MANMSLNVNMENLTEEERNQLLALVKKSTEEKPKVWKPEDKKEYYFINAGGCICDDIWTNCILDNNLYAIGNCFKTEKEAEFALEKLKVIAELKRFAQERNDKIYWNNGSWKYYIAYDYTANKVIYMSAMTSKRNDIYFTSEEIAQQAIKTIGADRLKKYYFEVED